MKSGHWDANENCRQRQMLGHSQLCIKSSQKGYLNISVKWQSSPEGCFRMDLKNCFLIYVCSIHTKIRGLTGVSQH